MPLQVGMSGEGALAPPHDELKGKLLQYDSRIVTL